MSLPSLPAQHLTDEAVAAYADGALGRAARVRAARHIAECAECAEAIAVQREAVLALRAAAAPCLPGGLLDRLRAVPSTTPLNQQPLALDRNGSAMFAAFGTPVVEADPPPPPAPPEVSFSGHRRHRPYGLVAAAAAIVALGTAGIAVAGAGEGGSTPADPAAPGAPANVRPAVFDPSQALFTESLTGFTRAVRAPR